MATSCHILIENNPVVIYASRNGSPQKVLHILEPFIQTFWQEREIAGESHYTPECLAAQIIVRFGYEICEDDFSNLRVGLAYDSKVEYLYLISLDRKITVWVPQETYRTNPKIGLQGCCQIVVQSLTVEC
jgi:hypothetical protein